jgi:hypothetical protein
VWAQPPAKNAPAFVRDLLTAWRQSPDAADFHQFIDRDDKHFDGAPADVATLVASVRLLHESLDSSLRFKGAAK